MNNILGSSAIFNQFAFNPLSPGGGGGVKFHPPSDFFRLLSARFTNCPKILCNFVKSGLTTFAKNRMSITVTVFKIFAFSAGWVSPKLRFLCKIMLKS